MCRTHVPGRLQVVSVSFFDFAKSYHQKMIFSFNTFLMNLQQTQSLRFSEGSERSKLIKTQNLHISSYREPRRAERLCLRCVELVFQEDCKWFRWVSSTLQKVITKKWYFPSMYSMNLQQTQSLRVSEGSERSNDQNHKINLSRVLDGVGGKIVITMRRTRVSGRLQVVSVSSSTLQKITKMIITSIIPCPLSPLLKIP